MTQASIFEMNEARARMLAQSEEVYRAAEIDPEGRVKPTPSYQDFIAQVRAKALESQPKDGKMDQVV